MMVGLGEKQSKGWENPMDRRAWRATVHRWQRVGHDLPSKQQQPHPPAAW